MNRTKRTEKLQVHEYTNGVILPRKMIGTEPMWGLGGVCDSNNRFVESSFYDGGWAKHGGYYEWDTEEYTHEDVVYVGIIFQHWGHFLVDLTGRMWFLKQLSETRTDFKVAYLGEEEPTENNLKFFELLGIQKKQLLHIQKPTRFKRVFVPEQSFKSCEWYTEEFVQMFDAICDAALNNAYDFSKVKGLEKIYFTRRHFKKAVHSEFGEEYFEKCFAENGYTSVAPELLSLEEQIYIWNHAKEIVCINGTIPLNVVFSRNRNLKLTILNKMSLYHENPIILLEMRGITARFIDIFKEPMRGYPKSLGEGPYLLWPSSQFQSFCAENEIQCSISSKESKRYFMIQQVRYYFSIILLKINFRYRISKMMPQKVKLLVRKIKKVRRCCF